MECPSDYLDFEFPESPCIITNEGEAISECRAYEWRDWNPSNSDTNIQLRNAWDLSPRVADTLRPADGNSIRLREDLCTTYNNGNWALVPELPVLKEIAIKALTFEHSAEAWPSYLASFPQMERAYKFVHFCGSPSVIVRFNDDLLQDTNTFVVHKKPFENFPTIHFGVHPYFVIANVARNVLRQRKNKTKVTEQPSDIQECLDLCIVIYRQWLSLGRGRPAQPTPVKPSPLGSSRIVKSRPSQPSRASSSAQNQGRAKQGKRALSDSDYEPPANKSLRASR